MRCINCKKDIGSAESVSMTIRKYKNRLVYEVRRRR